MAGRLRAYNPLSVAGTALPPPLLLMAKLIGVAYLLRGGLGSLSIPFLPFIPWLDRLPHTVLTRGLQAAFAAALVALLVNRRVRTASLVLGVTVLVAIVASRPYYQNNRMFAGAILVLTGLYQPGFASQLVRYQVVLLYAAAAINKLLDPGWQSGAFFSSWSSVASPGMASALGAHLPSATVFLAMSWLVIVTEFAIALALLVRPWLGVGAWLGIAYHTALLLLAGRTFGVFWFALLSAFLALAWWPPASGTVTFPEAGEGWQHRLGRLLRWLDFDRHFNWTPAGADQARLERPGGEASRGWTALGTVLLSLPAPYLALIVVAARLPEAMVRIPALVVVLVLAITAYRYMKVRGGRLQRRHGGRLVGVASRA